MTSATNKWAPVNTLEGLDAAQGFNHFDGHAVADALRKFPRVFKKFVYVPNQAELWVRTTLFMRVELLQVSDAFFYADEFSDYDNDVDWSQEGRTDAEIEALTQMCTHPEPDDILVRIWWD